jgi:hypothetical protein
VLVAAVQAFWPRVSLVVVESIELGLANLRVACVLCCQMLVQVSVAEASASLSTSS